MPQILTDSNALPRTILRLLPFMRWLPGITRQSARADLLAGLTGAVIVLPQCVAFATLAGMPVEYGLYCAMVPAVIAALFGSSWHLVSGPTNAISIVLFASLAPLAEPGSARYVELALTVTLLVGAMQLAMGLARLGTLVNFISHTVIVGFMAAAAVVIIDAQLKTFFGIDIPRGAGFFETWGALLLRVDGIDLQVTLVSLVTLGCAIALRHYVPRWPYMIIAMAIGALAALAIDAASGGRSGITTVGALPASLPPLSLPDLSTAAIRETGAIALAITILALTEAVSIARSIAVRSGQRIDSTQEFTGQGLSNIAGAFFSSYPSSGSFNRSGVNYDAGARSPLAAASSALFLLAILFAVAPLAAYLPHAAMAAVLMVVAWGLIDFKGIRQILQASRTESAVLVLTFLSGVLISLEFCILAGVMLSLMLYLNRTSKPALVQLVPASDADGTRRFVPVSASAPPPAGCPRLLVLRIDGSLFYGAVEHVRDRLLELTGAAGQPHNLLLLGDGINLMDIAGAHMIEVEAHRLAAAGGGLYLAALKPTVREMLERSGALAALGAGHVFERKGDAIAAILARRNTATCAACTGCAFDECRLAAPAAPAQDAR
ncbi:MAG: SulP family inorganic anion transporter [bacterium]